MGVEIHKTSEAKNRGLPFKMAARPVHPVRGIEAKTERFERGNNDEEAGK